MRPFPTSEKHGAAQGWVVRRVGRVLAAFLAFAVVSAANESWAQEPSKSATGETKKGSKKKKRKSSKSAPRTETVELEEEAPPPPPPKRGSYWGAGDGQDSPSTSSPPAAAPAPAPPAQATPSAPSRPPTKPESTPSERDLPPSTPADLSSKSADEPPKAAPADGAPQARRLEGSLLAGFGLNRGLCDNQSCNAYGLGFGLRVGTQVVGSVFVGVGATVHLGSSTPRPVANFQRNYTRSVAYAGLEVGYDVPIASLMVRPYAGIGAGYTKKLIVSNLPAEVGNDKQESGHGMGLAAWPGVLVRTMVAGKYPVGIDVRYALMPSAESAITGFGTAGMVF